MKGSDAQATYYYATSKISDICRQLSLAGIALIWVFHSTENKVFILPFELILPGIFFFASLFLDFIHYIVMNKKWGPFANKPADQDINPPPGINISLDRLFIIKIASVILGFILLFEYMVFIIKTH